MEEIRIFLSEDDFFRVTKSGIIHYKSEINGRSELPLYTKDMLNLYNGEDVTKNILGEKIIIRCGVDKDTFKRIIKNSPIYSSVILA